MSTEQGYLSRWPIHYVITTTHLQQPITVGTIPQSHPPYLVELQHIEKVEKLPILLLV